MQGNTYWREQLPREAQAAYDGMYRHFRMGDYRFTMPMAAGQHIQAAQQAVMQDHADLSGHQVYACGAPIVVESARTDYTERCGLPADEFYADAFTSEADKHGG